MKLSEARTECERWFAYLQQQEVRSVELQQLAFDRRAGTCDDTEMHLWRMARIDSSVIVYDGAKLVEGCALSIRACVEN